jgi:magnesium-transporting ATPase (P-type)
MNKELRRLDYMKNVGILSKWIITITMILIFIFIIAFALYFFHGSLEMYPTEEQQDKIHSITSLIIVALIIIEAVLFFAYKRVTKIKNCHIKK